MAELQPKFQRDQYQFTAHLRDPQSNPSPADIEDRRMEIYRGLLYRNVQGFIASSFPVLRKLYAEQDWHDMVRMFFANHQSHSPYFKDISKEFLSYLTEEHEIRPCDPPFLLELAHYEWIEIHFALKDFDLNSLPLDANGDLLTGIPVLSPFAQMFSYQFPVHRISPDFQPQQPSEQPTFLVISRDLADKVGFMEMNPVTARLMELLESNQHRSGQQLLEQIHEELPSIPADSLLHGGQQTLTQLRKKDILLGTRR